MYSSSEDTDAYYEKLYSVRFHALELSHTLWKVTKKLDNSEYPAIVLVAESVYTIDGTQTFYSVSDEHYGHFFIVTMRLLISIQTGLFQKGPDRDLNPGPLAPKARIIPLDHRATRVFYV